jgi:hypothetical protein
MYNTSANNISVAEAVTESLSIRVNQHNTTKTAVTIILHELNVTDSGVENGLMDSESDWRGKFYNAVFKNGRHASCFNVLRLY